LYKISIGDLRQFLGSSPIELERHPFAFKDYKYIFEMVYRHDVAKCQESDEGLT